MPPILKGSFTADLKAGQPQWYVDPDTPYEKIKVWISAWRS